MNIRNNNNIHNKRQGWNYTLYCVLRYLPIVLLLLFVLSLSIFFPKLFPSKNEMATSIPSSSLALQQDASSLKDIIDAKQEENIKAFVAAIEQEEEHVDGNDMDPAMQTKEQKGPTATTTATSTAIANTNEKRFDKSKTVEIDSALQYADDKWGYSRETCKKQWYRISHMDIDKKWQPTPKMKWTLEENPIWNCRGRTALPTRIWRKSLKRYTFGGFTADLGWPLAVAVYSLEDEDNLCPDFTPYWGHGCDKDDVINHALNQGNGSWTCFFEPARNPEYAKEDQKKYGAPKELLHEDEPQRHLVKRRDKYYVKNPEHHLRYKKLGKIIGLERYDNDLQTWQAVYHWLYRLKPEVRAKVDKRKREVLAKGGLSEFIEERDPYIAVHIRLGDKVGLKSGPLEAHVPYEIQDFAKYMLCNYQGDPEKIPIPKKIFVATDDFSAVKRLEDHLGPEFQLFTSADPQAHTGFSITEYQLQWSLEEKFKAAINLWADMEIMAEADKFVGSFQSNIPRMVNLMRMGKPANTTINMDPIGASRCSDANENVRPNTGQLYYCP